MDFGSEFKKCLKETRDKVPVVIWIILFLLMLIYSLASTIIAVRNRKKVRET